MTFEQRFAQSPLRQKWLAGEPPRRRCCEIRPISISKQKTFAFDFDSELQIFPREGLKQLSRHAVEDWQFKTLSLLMEKLLTSFQSWDD